MYQWARPAIAIPTHGERRHLLEHAALAKEMQVPQTVAPRNGDMVRLAPGLAGIVDEVPAGRLYVDAGVVTPENGQALRERRHAAFNGMIAVSIALDHRGRIAAGPTVRTLGLPEGEGFVLDEAIDELTEAAGQAIARLTAEAREDDEAVEAALARVLKKAAFRIWKRRPVVEPAVLRV